MKLNHRISSLFPRSHWLRKLHRCCDWLKTQSIIAVVWGFPGLTAAVTGRRGQEERSMAALFKGSRNIWLRWNRHVEFAFGNVFVHVVICCLFFSPRWLVLQRRKLYSSLLASWLAFRGKCKQLNHCS